MSKREDLMVAAKRLFWKHGISRVTVEEICEEAGASKMTFYRKFESKNHIALSVLKAFYQKATLEIKLLLEDIAKPFEERMKEFMLMKVRYSEGISTELMQDLLKNGDAEVMDFIRQERENQIQYFMLQLSNAQLRGELRSNLNLAAIPLLLTYLGQMSADPAWMNSYQTPEEATEDLMGIFLYGIIGKKEEA